MDSKSFETHRPRLYGLAYRMLGIRAEAEDVVQEGYLRWREVDPAKIRSAEAFLTTTVTRLCIDRLRKLKLERETYFGPWLPEPLAAEDLRTPEMEAELRDDVSIAFLALLEALSPEERAAFVLHDVLDDDYADIAEALGKTAAACRQLVHRARERVTAKRRRFQIDDATRQRVLERFMAAANAGDRQRIIEVLSTDAVMISDGGGKAVAVHRPLLGSERISWFWHTVSRRFYSQVQSRIVRVNGELGIAYYDAGRLQTLLVFETDAERVHRIYALRNPEKLQAFAGTEAVTTA